jgi:hypothetical protein
LHTDASTHSPTAWEWYYDGSTLGSTLQNPWHTYNVAGNYYPKLKASNAYGSDIYIPFTPFLVYSACQFPNYTEVDPTSAMVPGIYGVTVTGLAANVSAYFYRDYGVDYFSTFTLTMLCRVLVSVPGLYGMWWRVANDVGDGNVYPNGCIMLYHYHDGTAGKVRLVLGYYDGAGGGAEDSYLATIGTIYCVKIVRTLTNTVTAYIYSDIGMTILLDTLVISSANLINKKFRYHYGCGSINTGNANVWTGDSWSIVYQSLYGVI